MHFGEKQVKIGVIETERRHAECCVQVICHLTNRSMVAQLLQGAGPRRHVTERGELGGREHTRVFVDYARPSRIVQEPCQLSQRP
jgi:hypothetical protein